MAEIKTVEMTATVQITINDREPIERVIGPSGDEWRDQLYPSLVAEADVLNHWAACAMRGYEDVSRLEGWADVTPNTVTMRLVNVQGDAS